jgi:hypothetical protein
MRVLAERVSIVLWKIHESVSVNRHGDSEADMFLDRPNEFHENLYPRVFAERRAFGAKPALEIEQALAHVQACNSVGSEQMHPFFV